MSNNLKLTTMIETYRGLVYPWNCDHMNHMNVQFYVAKFDEATWQLFAYLGITTPYMKSNNRGMVALEQNIKYKRELISGDAIFIKSKIIQIEEKKIRFIHEMYNMDKNEIAAETELLGMHIDTSIRKSCKFPEDVFQKAKSFIEDELPTK